ncbi:5-oxoprolinase, partial [Mesorhizobium sp. M7A.F.Ca.CA.003.01.2.1]
ATVERRAAMRKERLAKAIPVADWIAKERGRVGKADFAPEVKKMYASAIKLSSRFTKEFSDFWNVDAKSIFTPGAKP